jgi:WD40 repeat protein
LAAIDENGTIRVWNLADATLVITLTLSDQADSTYQIFSPDIAWSPDGMRIAAASNNSIWMWDLSRADPASNPTVLPQESEIGDIDWSPDGRRLAAMGRDGIVHVWTLAPDAGENNSIVLHPAGSDERYLDINSPQELNLSWSPDGRWLATRAVNLLQLWDLAAGDPETSFILLRHDAPVTAFAWHPHQPYVAVASGHVLTEGRPRTDSKIQLWSLTTDTPVTEPILLLHENASNLYEIAWAQDGKQLAGWSPSSNLIWFWTTEVAELIQISCGAAGRNLTQGEWNQYFQDQPYQQTCPQWQSGLASATTGP